MKCDFVGYILPEVDSVDINTPLIIDDCQNEVVSGLTRCEKHAGEDEVTPQAFLEALIEEQSA